MIRNYIRIAFRNLTRASFRLFRKVDDLNAGQVFLPAFISILPNEAPARDVRQYGTTLPLNNISDGSAHVEPVSLVLFPRLITHQFQYQSLRCLSRNSSASEYINDQLPDCRTTQSVGCLQSKYKKS